MNDSRTATTRRRLLGAVAAGGAASLGGCLGRLRERAAGGDDAPGTGGPRDVLRFDALDVAGSPGGTVPLRPPDRPALIDFFATWCGPCRPQMDTLGRVRDTFATDELHVVSVTTESDTGAVERFWRRYDGAWPVAQNPDGTAPRRYSVKGLPTLVVVSPDGTEHWRHRGLAGFDRIRTEVGAVVDG